MEKVRQKENKKELKTNLSQEKRERGKDGRREDGITRGLGGGIAKGEERMEINKVW